MITIRELIDADRQALASGRLQAQALVGKGGTCRYLDETTGTSCAIGQVLSDDLRHRLHGTRFNTVGIGSLVKDAGLGLEVEDLEVFKATQVMHDSWSMQKSPGQYEWASDTWQIFDLRPQALAFFNSVGVVGEAEFRQWLDIIEQEYCA